MVINSNPVSEKRQFPRFDVYWKASIVRLNGERLVGSTDNISRIGVNIILPCRLIEGEPVEVELISLSQGQTNYFRLRGEVIYCTCLESNLGTAVGLQLLQPDDQYLALLIGLENQHGTNYA